MKVLVFSAPGFQSLPEFTAEDAVAVVSSMGLTCKPIDSLSLEHLERDQADLLILPYIKGNFSIAALNGLIRFHASGGSLLFLGDLPNHEAWFPFRNMESWRFHLTRCHDGLCVTGLTDFGRTLLGDLPGLGEILGQHMPALRVTAFPPDETHRLFTIKSYDHSTESRAVVCVDRKSERFLGARLAVVGFNGGEPRENVQGVYSLPWQQNPGLLNRQWAGCHPLLHGLIRWLQPQQVAGAIEVEPVHAANIRSPLVVRLATPAGQPVRLARVFLKHGDHTLELPELAGLLTGPRALSIPLPPRPFGINRFSLSVETEKGSLLLADAQEYVTPADISTNLGFGASTFWAFQGGTVPEEYRTFVREMRRRGCQYIRANLPWEDIEPEPGRYDWTIPDALADFARSEGLYFSFWLFPVTRGAALGDGGVPAWSLKEPALDKDGNPGNFPTLWSPFYRHHYFAMIDNLTKRYASHPGIWRFILDFGNSDFPYGYYYYGNPPTLFDYSPQERRAFCRYLIEQRGLSIEQVSAVYGRNFTSFDEVPVPLADTDIEAWRIYLDFRSWTIQGGIEEAFRVCSANAPDKTPPDLPGHGVGSMADLSSFFLEAKSKHWLEERKFEPRHVAFHNAGAEWGGEAWQVGGDYRQYDDALFQSLRVDADYYTIPGPDLGVYGDAIARNGFIRRTMMGATRPDPALAVIDRTGWNDWASLANVAARLDQSAALLCRSHRYDFSCYRLLALPPDELVGHTATMGTGGSLLPIDEGWYWLILESITKGLNLLVFPNSCRTERTQVPLTFLRKVLKINDVKYGAREKGTIVWPDSFAGGHGSGMIQAVHAEGEVLVRDRKGMPIVVRRPCGRGSILLAGYDCAPDSPDGDHQYERDRLIAHHSLNRVCQHLGIVPDSVKTGQLYVAKQLVQRAGRDYLLMFSHLPQTVPAAVQVKLSKPSKQAYDLATGECFEVRPGSDGWSSLQFPLHTRTGRYLSFHD